MLHLGERREILRPATLQRAADRCRLAAVETMLLEAAVQQPPATLHGVHAGVRLASG